MRQTRLYSNHKQLNGKMIEFFGEVTGDHVCSNTEWDVLQLKKAQVTEAKIKELEGKKWFQVLTTQYKHLL